jgi:hypothetical protein
MSQSQSLRKEQFQDLRNSVKQRLQRAELEQAQRRRAAALAALLKMGLKLLPLPLLVLYLFYTQKVLPASKNVTIEGHNHQVAFRPRFEQEAVAHLHAAVTQQQHMRGMSVPDLASGPAGEGAAAAAAAAADCSFCAV